MARRSLFSILALAALAGTALNAAPAAAGGYGSYGGGYGNYDRYQARKHHDHRPIRQEVTPRGAQNFQEDFRNPRPEILEDFRGEAAADGRDQLFEVEPREEAPDNRGAERVGAAPVNAEDVSPEAISRACNDLPCEPTAQRAADPRAQTDGTQAGSTVSQGAPAPVAAPEAADRPARQAAPQSDGGRKSEITEPREDATPG